MGTTGSVTALLRALSLRDKATVVLLGSVGIACMALAVTSYDAAANTIRLLVAGFAIGWAYMVVDERRRDIRRVPDRDPVAHRGQSARPRKPTGRMRAGSPSGGRRARGASARDRVWVCEDSKLRKRALSKADA